MAYSLNELINTRPDKPKLLVVDDQTVNIQLFHEIFRKEFDIFMASNGEQALQKCKMLIPDLILLDVVMPVMDGYEVCRQLKEDALLSLIPVIFVTSHYDEESEVLGFELGAVDFIHKPINRTITRARVFNHLTLKLQADLLRNMALVDRLTGIANRHKFESALITSWLQCSRTKEPLSLLMIDVDKFKTYNDTYGHPQGDVCLRQIAQCLANALNRPYDLVARYGGEEFVCLLPHTDSQGASYLANQLEQQVRALAIVHPTAETNHIVTISIGCATTVPNHDTDADQLVLAADKQLYKAKENGRGQVMITDSILN